VGLASFKLPRDTPPAHLFNKGNVMINTLVILLIFAVVVFVAFWIVAQVGLPNPLNWIAKSIIAIIALMFLVQKLGIAIPI